MKRASEMLRRVRCLVPLLVAGLLSLVLPRAELAHAATFTVTTTTDAPHTTPMNGNCTSTLPGNPCTLRAAVQAANTLGGGPHSIIVPAGTYVLTAGTINIQAIVSIIGNGAGNTIIDGNRTRSIILQIAISAAADISGVTIRNGNSPNVGGAGISVINDAALTLRNSIVSDNVGHGIGNVGNTTLANVTITRNTDSGISNGSVSPSTGILSVTNSTITGNDVGITNSLGRITIANGTVSNNSRANLINGSNPTGVNQGSPITVINSTIGGGLPAQSCIGTITSNGYNIDSGNTCGFNGPGDLINTDPKLGPLADNGGSTLTHALLPGSPGIDAGNPACPPPSTDQRGFLRPAGPRCDIGAFELNAISPTPAIIPTSTPTQTVAALLPDLAVTFMRIELETGGACNFSSTALGIRVGIANNGAASAGPFNVQVNGAVQRVAGLAAGQTTSLWFPGYLTGENPAVVDSSNEVQESNESNNQLSALLPIPTLPPTCTATPTTTPTTTSTPTTTPTAAATPAAVSPLNPPPLSGQAGTPCATQVGQTCGISGAASGTWTKTGSGTFRITATGPANTAPLGRPRIFLATTVGVESALCTAVPALAPFSTTCAGITDGNLLQGATITVRFPLVGGGTFDLTGAVIGPGVPTPAVPVAVVVPQPLLPPPPPLVLPPPPAPLIPVPPAARRAAAPPEIPIIPETDTAALLLGGLVGLGAVARWRRREHRAR